MKGIGKGWAKESRKGRDNRRAEGRRHEGGIGAG